MLVTCPIYPQHACCRVRHPGRRAPGLLQAEPQPHAAASSQACSAACQPCAMQWPAVHLSPLPHSKHEPAVCARCPPTAPELDPCMSSAWHMYGPPALKEGMCPDRSRKVCVRNMRLQSMQSCALSARSPDTWRAAPRPGGGGARSKAHPCTSSAAHSCVFWTHSILGHRRGQPRQGKKITSFHASAQGRGGSKVHSCGACAGDCAGLNPQP